MIKLQVIGHLGNDSEVREVNGKSVVNFDVAHTESYKDQNGTKVNKTLWVSCAYWVDRITIAQYLKKGTLVFVEGMPEVSTYKNKDNQVIPQLKLRVLNVQLLGSNQNNQQQRQQQSSDASFERHLGNHTTELEDSQQGLVDDLPF